MRDIYFGIYLGIYFQREWLPLAVIAVSENVTLTCYEKMHQLYLEAEERLDSAIACYDLASALMSALTASLGCPVPNLECFPGCGSCQTPKRRKCLHGSRAARRFCGFPWEYIRTETVICLRQHHSSQEHSVQTSQQSLTR